MHESRIISKCYQYIDKEKYIFIQPTLFYVASLNNFEDELFICNYLFYFNYTIFLEKKGFSKSIFTEKTIYDYLLSQMFNLHQDRVVKNVFHKAILWPVWIPTCANVYIIYIFLLIIRHEILSTQIIFRNHNHRIFLPE